MTKWAMPIVAGLFVFVFSSSVFAQPQSPPPRGGRDQRANPRMQQAVDMMFQDMDTNHDGKISKKEWAAAQDRQFRTLDKNGDGFITKDEVMADVKERMREAPQPGENRRAPQ